MTNNVLLHVEWMDKSRVQFIPLFELRDKLGAEQINESEGMYELRRFLDEIIQQRSAPR